MSGFILAVGSLTDGLTFTGPFPDSESAIEEAQQFDGNWSVIPLGAPYVTEAEPANLVRFTAEDAAKAAGRPLTKSELRAVVKALPFSTMGEAFMTVVESIASMPDEDDDGVEGRAGDVLEVGVIYREIGGEWECVREVDWHGDTVLVTTWRGGQRSYDHDEVIDTITIEEG